LLRSDNPPMISRPDLKNSWKKRYCIQKAELEQRIDTLNRHNIQKELSYKQELNTVKAELEAKTNHANEASFNLKKLTEKNESSSAELCNLRDAVSNLEQANENLKKQTQKTEEDLSYTIAEKNMKLEELKKKFTDIEARIDSLHGLYEKEKQKGEVLESQLDKKQLELQRLKEGSVIEKRLLEEQLRKKDFDLLKTHQKVEEVSTNLKAKSYKEDELKKQLRETELNALENKEQFRRIQKEKETYEMLAEQRKKESELNRKLRENQLSQSIDLMKEKKSLEGKLLEKEIEANRVKRDLNLIKGTHNELLDEKLNKERELDALKDHVGVLSGQNMAVNG